MPVVAMALRNDLLRDAAREYRARESRLVRMVERAPGLVERLRQPRIRYRACLEAAVLEAALQDRVALVGRRSMRPGIDAAEATHPITGCDDGVRARVRQMFDVDWTGPLLYDLVVNMETIGVMTAVDQVLAARVRAIRKATPATARVDVDPQAAEGQVRLAGVVGSEAEREGCSPLLATRRT